MKRGEDLAGFLFEPGAGSPQETLRDRELLVRRLLLAEILAKPPALREPGERSPLSPVADRRD